MSDQGCTDPLSLRTGITRGKRNDLISFQPTVFNYQPKETLGLLSLKTWRLFALKLIGDVGKPSFTASRLADVRVART